MECPNCGSNDVKRLGVTQGWDSEPAYECRDCGRHFTKDQCPSAQDWDAANFSASSEAARARASSPRRR